MPQASKKRASAPPLTGHIVKNIKEISVITLIVSAVYLVIALFSYHPGDPGWSLTVTTDAIHNNGGKVGAYLADILLYLFGYVGYWVPLILLFDGLRIFRSRTDIEPVNHLALALRSAGLLMLLLGSCALAWMHIQSGGGLPHEIRGAGGILGDGFGSLITDNFGWYGSTLLLLATFLVGLTLYTELSWDWLLQTTGRLTLALTHRIRLRLSDFREQAEGRKLRRERETVLVKEQEKVVNRRPPVIEPVISSFEPSSRKEKEKQTQLFAPPVDSALPPLDLLDEPGVKTGQYSKEALEAMSRLVELKLRDFGIEVEVVAVNPGPVITRFELQPAAGVKGGQISNLSKDLARSLSVVSVRVVDVIAGKSVIGLEIPNEARELVVLSEILSSKEYEGLNSATVLGLGKDISGNPVVTDLSRMPHLLVAGTTGSGKSVAINAMIISLLYKATARDIRLIMIDPKMLELSVYEGIPHLLTPVVTDMKEAANALRWCVSEMDRRYKLMAALGVRNIGGYNKKIKEGIDRKEPVLDPIYKPVSDDDTIPALEELPFIVIIIDELADMMLTVGKKVEELIARLAQKARASGIHLILATQRPSVDVITGLIKANIPARIAFQVSSKVDSRTILDQMGAENLLGHGDMLFLPSGTSIPERVHGAFVDDHEVHRIVENIKSHGEPDYLEEILCDPGAGGAEPIPGLDTPAGDVDPLYDEAVRVVTESRKASISYIQRRLKIGYNRAARIVEEMEASGLVGPLESNGGREILAAPPPPID
ncbi:MAG: DNA translocase FtsK [Gammaproteobacteria bacterium]